MIKLKEKDIPERCKTCENMKRWSLPVDGEPEYSCVGGRVPAMELYCNRYKERKHENENSDAV